MVLLNSKFWTLSCQRYFIKDGFLSVLFAAFTSSAGHGPAHGKYLINVWWMNEEIDRVYGVKGPIPTEILEAGRRRYK